MPSRNVYLDNSATTRPSDAVVSAMLRVLTESWHNPSALYQPAMQAEKLMNAARESCLKAAGASGHTLVFTAGGTEADNLGILGYLRTVKKPGRVLLFSVEHPAVLNCAQEIERMGHRVAHIPVTKTGVCDLDRLEAMLGEDVHLITLMQVNNEVGAIQPIEEVVKLRDRLCPKAAIHVDGVQGFLRVPFHFGKSGIQSYAFSGHKLHASKGVGGLILRKGHRVAPIVFGGGQEGELRSGTENVPGIVGMGEAVRTYPKDAAAQMTALKARLWAGIQAAVPMAKLNGPALDDPACAPHILNVTLSPVRSQTMLFALEGEGVYVSAGSACGAHKQKVSSVLTAMGLSTAEADCALRFSLCPAVTEEEIDYTIAAIRKHYDLLKAFVRR
ncbi:MAG: cysteine desulfurase family protein [Clostridiales bacterium]|nr:cysteine desulfurase family protein [Clostridiales bacterium]